MIDIPTEGHLKWAFVIGSAILAVVILLLLKAGIRKLKWALSPRRKKYRKRKGKSYASSSYWIYYVRVLKSKPYFLFFDTEATGLPKDFKAKAAADDNWPRLVQLAWIITDTRAGMKDMISGMTGIDTMESSKHFCGLHKPDRTIKRPELQELYTTLFGEEFKDAHDAMADVTATMECFEELLRIGVINIAGYNINSLHEQ